jgi:hypothetical protein
LSLSKPVIGEPLDQPCVPAGAVDEVGDADVLVVGVDGLALGPGHPEGGEAVDVLADRGEVARVGGRHHHVGRGDRVGEHLADAALEELEGLVHR